MAHVVKLELRHFIATEETTTMINNSKTLGKVVQIDDRRIQDHLGEVGDQRVDCIIIVDDYCNTGFYQKNTVKTKRNPALTNLMYTQHLQ